VGAEKRWCGYQTERGDITYELQKKKGLLHGLVNRANGTKVLTREPSRAREP
jgi:hypothetical protein